MSTASLSVAKDSSSSARLEMSYFSSLLPLEWVLAQSCPLKCQIVRIPPTYPVWLVRKSLLSSDWQRTGGRSISGIVSVFACRVLWRNCHLCLRVVPFSERTPLLVLVPAPLLSARNNRPSAASILACCPFVILSIVIPRRPDARRHRTMKTEFAFI